MLLRRVLREPSRTERVSSFMKALAVLSFASLAACSQGRAAEPRLPDERPATQVQTQAASASPGKPSSTCSLRGTWRLTLGDEGGCEVPESVTIVDGVGEDEGFDILLRPSDTDCVYVVTGGRGALFHIEGSVTQTGDQLTGIAEGKSGFTAYSCGGDFSIRGLRTP
ncbi:MAG: hypothetical protein U0271_28280 [Polyangiaceae bacterium]